MARPDVVEYLRQNLTKHPLEALRRQLSEEGVSAAEFDACLAEARKKPAPAASAKKAKPAAKLLAAGGLALLAAAALFVASRKPAAPSGPAAAPPSGESGFVGAHGWVVRLPKDYAAVSEFKHGDKSDELVHFCPRGTDPTNFLNEGLFGQMGIVRLEVTPSQFPPNPVGAASLAAAVGRKTASHGEKYELKNIQIATLSGVQVNVLAPFPRVEAYIIGSSDMYFFYAGQEDEIWRAIVLSLRDVQSEN